MTVSVAFDGVVVDTADVAANWTAVKITSGGQSPTAVAADAAYEGTNNVTCRSDNKRVYMYTDSGTTYDFTPDSSGSGAVKVPNELFYIWVNFLPSPLLNTQAGGGLGIMMSSVAPSSSQYSLWYFHGRDTYTGGWVRLAIDPNKIRSTGGSSSFDAGNVRYFGAFAHNNQGAAKYDNFVVDQCAIGKGIIVTGSSTLGLVEELIANEEANRHGIVTALNDAGTAVEVLGKITLGDNAGSVATNINDSDSKIFVAEPVYHNGTSLVASCQLDFAGIDIVGNGVGNTDIVFGSAVGTDNGRNGISIVSNPTYNFGLDRDDGAVESADFYGCSLENLTGTLALDATHDFNGCTLVGASILSVNSDIKNPTSVGSDQIQLATGVKIINGLIINNTNASAIDTEDLANVDACTFAKGASGHAVQLTGAATTYNWNNNTSGYDTGTAANGVQVTGGSITGDEDIFITASTGTFIINVADGVTVPSVATNGALVNVISGQKTLTITNIPVGAEVRLYDNEVASNGQYDTELAGIESNPTTSFTYTHAGIANDIIVQVMASGYVELDQEFPLAASDQTLPLDLKLETN